jgi:hypothetical protein
MASCGGAVVRGSETAARGADGGTAGARRHDDTAGVRQRGGAGQRARDGAARGSERGAAAAEEETWQRWRTR